MLYSGLVSISFRPLDIEQIIALALKGGLSSVEWGGDVHVPHGDLRTARTVGRQTSEAGLRVSSYGTYYKAGHKQNFSFSAVLDTAAALGAPRIRIWAGEKGSAQAGLDYRRRVVDDALAIAGQAASFNIAVAFEYHGGTLTDTAASAVKLMGEELRHENIQTFWQPTWQASFEYSLESLRAIKKWLANVHCFAWNTQQRRLALAAQESAWQAYLEIIKEVPGDRDVLLEFVEADDPDNLIRDAGVLNAWLKRINQAL